jgi:hypothetical protein
MIQDDPRTVRRYRVKDAAVLLGVSTQAIRHRIRRGTLDSEKDDGGVVWVLLDPATVSADYPPDDPQDSPQDDPGTPSDGPGDQSLLDLVEILREQLAAADARERRSDERERELRRIIAGLVQRVPELPSVDSPQDGPPDGPQNVRSDERDEPQNASEEADRGGTTPPRDQGEPRRSWWSKLFGLE